MSWAAVHEPAAQASRNMRLRVEADPLSGGHTA